MERKKDKTIRKGRSRVEIVRTGRRWRAEEKLAIIKEANEDSSVTEVCGKHFIDFSMPYWKYSSKIQGD